MSQPQSSLITEDHELNPQAPRGERLHRDAQGQARNIHYLVTPDGVDLIAKRSYRYLRRTVGHVVTGVLLVGESDLEFLVEWCAEKASLSFRHQIDATSPRSRGPSATQQPLFEEYVIASEQIPRAVAEGDSNPAWDLHLADLAVRSARATVLRNRLKNPAISWRIVDDDAAKAEPYGRDVGCEADVLYRSLRPPDVAVDTEYREDGIIFRCRGGPRQLFARCSAGRIEADRDYRIPSLSCTHPRFRHRSSPGDSPPR